MPVSASFPVTYSALAIFCLYFRSCLKRRWQGTVSQSVGAGVRVCWPARQPCYTRLSAELCALNEQPLIMLWMCVRRLVAREYSTPLGCWASRCKFGLQNDPADLAARDVFLSLGSGKLKPVIVKSELRDWQL